MKQSKLLIALLVIFLVIIGIITYSEKTNMSPSIVEYNNMDDLNKMFEMNKFDSCKVAVTKYAEMRGFDKYTKNIGKFRNYKEQNVYPFIIGHHKKEFLILLQIYG